MSLFGNIIWLIFGGFVSGIGYILGGVAVCLTIVGIPFGVQSIKLGIATMTPFGWEIAVAHLVHALLLAITIVGLPFAKQHLKLIPLALFPFGKELR